MGMFQRKTQTAVKPLYTIGLIKTVLIVGLGNPGKEYSATRHNLGFMCVDDYAQSHEFPKWNNKKDMKCSLTMQTLEDKRVILIKPTTFMNKSGEAVRAAQQFYEVAPEDTVIIHDELDIEFGEIRTRFGGGSAGHNGLKSLIEHIGENFGRVRIGIGKPKSKGSGAKFVLSKFSSEQSRQLDNLKREASIVIDEYLHTGSLSNETRSFIV